MAEGLDLSLQEISLDSKYLRICFCLVLCKLLIHTGCILMKF